MKFFQITKNQVFNTIFNFHKNQKKSLFWSDFHFAKLWSFIKCRHVPEKIAVLIRVPYSSGI